MIIQIIHSLEFSARLCHLEVSHDQLIPDITSFTLRNVIHFDERFNVRIGGFAHYVSIVLNFHRHGYSGGKATEMYSRHGIKREYPAKEVL